jgi:uncharacterized membrane protein
MSEYNENNRTSFEESAQESQELTLGQKVADAVAKFGGSWTFIGSFAFFMFVWVTINSMTWFHVMRFDPFPYILLNLILSTIAALQAPVIMMSQNRQAEKDRAQQQEDREVNRQAELEIRNLKRQITELQKTHEEERRSRQEQTKLLQEIRRNQK